MKKGTAIFDGLAILEFEYRFVSGGSQLEAKAAFVHSKSGATHGSTTCYSWSPETMKKLNELLDAMESDLAARHFSESSTPITPESFGGIGEVLADEDDVKQI